MTFRLWPRSLATRTAFVVLAGLAIVQIAGLTIHALDRIDLQRIAQGREAATRVMSVYRNVVRVPPPQRDEALHEFELPPGTTATLSSLPPQTDLPPMPPGAQRLFRSDFGVVPLPGLLRPRETVVLGGGPFGKLAIGMRLPDGMWLDVETLLPPARPWHSVTFLSAFGLMTLVAAVLTLWAVRRLTAPVRTLAVAAEALGRDVNAPPLPEDGPLEVATAAAAFNTMASRIRRFVQDRTFLLTAIGHDLRTPITRMKLRAEFMEDDEQRQKMMADIEELESMVSATLAFGRDISTTEPVSPLDLSELLRNVIDEIGDARPEQAEKLAYQGPDHLTVKARPMALKRAFVNLISNALNYGGNALVSLQPQNAGNLTIEIADEGPGIPPGELERVFEPFHRVESSRNRETGGTGLGLPIARNILRAHGGDVVLANRPMGGATAIVTLPA